MSRSRNILDDTEILNWLIAWLSFNDTHPDSLPCRDWKNIKDARKALSQIIIKEKKKQKKTNGKLKT